MVKIDELNYSEKIGQLFFIGLEDEKISSEFLEMIEKYKIGGVILYKKNYSNYQKMIETINTIKKANEKNKIPLFISIDQEGGRVNRMPNEFENIKAPAKIIRTNNIELLKQSIDITSEMLKKSGINMNLAPVLDIQRFPDNHPIGDRCYGNNEEKVCKYGIEAMKQFQKNGIISVVKHFPGHGATKTDSHYLLPIVKEKIEKIEKEDMVPFERAVENQTDAIMVGHIIIKDFDKKYPATLSKNFINEYLRNKMKYNGLIITDDIKMRAIRFFYGSYNSAFRALNVGNDMVMMKIGYKKEKKIIDKIISKKIDIKEIDKKIERILNLKNKYNLDNNPVTGCNIDNINQKIQELNKQILY